MANEKIRILNLSVDYERHLEAAKDVMGILRPAWPRERIEAKKISGGMVNLLVRVRLDSDADLKNAIMVRIFNSHMEKAVSRDKEVLAMQLAHQAGCTPRLLAIMANAFVYEFAPGRMLDAKDLNDPKIIRAVGKVFAKFHLMDGIGADLIDLQGEPASYDFRFCHFDVMHKYIDNAPPTLADPEREKLRRKIVKSEEELHTEVDWLKEFLSDLDMPTSVAHMDSHARNVIYNEETDEASLIDFELVSNGFEAVDLVTMMSFDEVINAIGKYIGESKVELLSEEIKELWVKCYYEEKYKLQGKDPASLTEKQLQKHVLEHKIMRAMLTLHWGTMTMTALDNDHMPVTVEFTSFWHGFYDRVKAELPQLKTEYQMLM